MRAHTPLSARRPEHRRGGARGQDLVYFDAASEDDVERRRVAEAEGRRVGAKHLGQAALQVSAPHSAFPDTPNGSTG
eukprot:2588561-Rhodomonas_salina.2